MLPETPVPDQTPPRGKPRLRAKGKASWVVIGLHKVRFTGRSGFLLMVMVLEDEGLPIAHPELEFNMHCTWSPSRGT